MILNVTEEQKRAIEERGKTVIEFKKWCYDFIDMFKQKIDDIWNALMFFLQSVCDRIIIPCIDKIKEQLEFLSVHCVEYLRDHDIYFKDTENFPFTRSLGKKYRPDISSKVVYHRCRDRC